MGGGYPIEAVSEWSERSVEVAGWDRVSAEYLMRGRCVLTLSKPIGTPNALARVVYTGGYVLPGDPDPEPIEYGYAPQRLPADLENAAIEQAAAWFLNRDKSGLTRH